MKFQNFYRRLFLSEKTCAVSAVSAILLCGGTIVCGGLANRLQTFDYLALALRVILLLFLFYGYRKHNLLAMQAGCCGLLVSLLYHQASDVFNRLLAMGSAQIMSLGFWGSFFVACELMLLILEFFFLMNHFENYILNKKNYLRLVVNQTTVCMLLLLLFLLIFVFIQLKTSALLGAYYILYALSLVSAYVLVACNELILAIDTEG